MPARLERPCAPAAVLLYTRRDFAKLFNLRASAVREAGMNVLVAGGAGYIGSHTVKRLKEAGHTPVIYDNVSRGHQAVVDILKVPAVVADLNDKAALTKTLRDRRIDTVMHFAAFAYVGESVDKPLM